MKIVFRTEYYNDKLDKWVGLYESNNEDDKSLMYHAKFPIFGNPPTRIVKCEKIGVRKIHYKPIKILWTK